MKADSTASYIKKYSHLPVSELVLYIPGKSSIQDTVVVRDGSYVGQYSNKTLEQYREEHPSMIITSFDEAIMLTEELVKTDVSEITEERYNDMLECLWPIDWKQGSGTDSFKFREMYSGNITDIFAFIKDEVSGERRYFTFRDNVRMAHSEIIAKCSAFIAKGKNA
jgi:hypothetical protein